MQPTLPVIPDLSPSASIDAVGPWCVALTRSNFEDRLVHWLHTQGIPYFLPRFANSPKFKGFVFVAPSSDPAIPTAPGHPGPDFTDRLKRQSRCVCGFLFTANQPRLKQELNSLSANPSAHLLNKTPVGQLVRFVEGPLKDIEGVVADIPSIETATPPEGGVAAVSVKFQLLQIWVSQQIPVTWITPINEYVRG